MRSPTIARSLAVRAQIVLGSAEGESIRELAERLGVSQPTVCSWRRRYEAQGVAGLQSRARSGRRRRITFGHELAVVNATLRKPQAATHWSARRLAETVGLSRVSVHRIWRKYGLQPHRLEHFKFSTDPQFDRKLTDVVGLYLDPPERALVLCVDEKSQIQALNRTAPLLPLRPGIPAQMTHDYQRHPLKWEPHMYRDALLFPLLLVSLLSRFPSSRNPIFDPARSAATQAFMASSAQPPVQKMLVLSESTYA